MTAKSYQSKRTKQFQGPEHIQQMPTKFSLQDFASKTKDNPLTAALKENFDKGNTNKAAWDYMTLKQSAEEFEKLKQVCKKKLSFQNYFHIKEYVKMYKLFGRTLHGKMVHVW